MPGLPRTYLSATLRHYTQRRRRRLAPLLALASIMQVGVLLALLGALTLASGPAFTCAAGGWLIPPESTGRAAYLDLSAVFEKGAACGTPALTVVQAAALEAAPSDVLAPLVQEAQKRRAERLQAD